MLPYTRVCGASPIHARCAAHSAAHVQYKVSVGVDSSAGIIGSAWVTTDMQRSVPPYENFPEYMAGAQTWIESPDDAQALREEGYYQASSMSNTLVADKERWAGGASTALPRAMAMHTASVDLWPLGSVAAAVAQTVLHVYCLCSEAEGRPQFAYD